MKSTTFRRFGVAVAFCASLVLSVASSAFAQEAESPCPFLDDEIILYFSPSTHAAVPSVQKVWGTPEAKEAFDAFYARADADVAKEVDKKPEIADPFNYFKSLVTEFAGVPSFTQACFESYFKCIDGVVLAFDAPEAVEGSVHEKDLQNGLTLTYIVNENPSAIEPRKLFGEDRGVVEIVKENDNEVVGKLICKEGDKVKGEIFYGGAKVKDMDKYVVVLAGTQENVEKKITRFQNTNAFIAKRQGDQLLYFNWIFKEELFKKVVENLRAENGDEKAKALAEGLAKTKCFRIAGNGSEEGVCWSATVETTDAESAQVFADLLTGTLAIAKISLENKENPSDDDKFALDLVNNVEVTHEKDALEMTCTLKIDVEKMQKVADKICADIKKKYAK